MSECQRLFYGALCPTTGGDVDDGAVTAAGGFLAVLAGGDVDDGTVDTSLSPPGGMPAFVDGTDSSSGAGTFTIDVPTGATGDTVFYLFVVVDSTATVPTTPAGFTLESSGAFTGGIGGWWVYSAPWSVGLGSTITVDWSGSPVATAQAVTIRNVGAITFPTDAGGTGAIAAPGSFVVAVDGSLALANYATAGFWVTFVPSLGWTAAAADAGSTDSHAAYQADEGAGAIPDPAVTIDHTDDWGAHVVLIAPP